MNAPTATDGSTFRRALERSLRDSAGESGRQLVVVRRQAASLQLVARLAVTLPDSSWALRGESVADVRLGTQARPVGGVEMIWRNEPDSLEDFVDNALFSDLGDFFQFGAPLPQSGTKAGNVRYRITCRLDGREFEHLLLNVNVIPFDPRPTETTTLDTGLAELLPVNVPVVLVAQQLAERLLDYERAGGDVVNALYDMLVIADRLELPSLDELAEACAETFGLQNISWPPRIPSPVAIIGWDELVQKYAIRWRTPLEAHAALRAFWRPVFGRSQARTFWHADVWGWE